MAQFSIAWVDNWNGKTECENQHSENQPKEIELHKKMEQTCIARDYNWSGRKLVNIETQ